MRRCTCLTLVVVTLLATVERPDVEARGAPRLRRGMRMTVSATAYCKRGETASGDRTRRGIVAADPRVLPEGTVLKVVAPASYRGVYTVGDRGRAVKGREIDIFMPNCREAARFGRRRVQIQIESAPPA